MISPPFNAITWSFGAVPIIIYCLRGLKSYRKAGNPLSLMYAWIGLSVSAGFLFIGIPPFFTSSSSILIVSYFFATACFLSSLMSQTWLLWFIGLRKYVPLRSLLITCALFGLAILALQLGTSQAVVEYRPHLVEYTDATPVLVLKSALYILLAIPIGYFFLYQATVQKGWLVKAKSITTAAIFFTVCLAAVSTNILYRGGDTISSSKILDIVFSLLLLGCLLPRGRRAKAKNR